MSWQKYTYQIATKSGEEQWYTGHRYGSLVHNFACVLTHLKSGLKIAQFKSEEDTRRVGEYLMTNYAAEITAFDKAIKRKMNFETIKNLPEAATLVTKLKADDYFRRQIDEFGYKKETADEQPG